LLGYLLPRPRGHRCQQPAPARPARAGVNGVAATTTGRLHEPKTCTLEVPGAALHYDVRACGPRTRALHLLRCFAADRC